MKSTAACTMVTTAYPAIMDNLLAEEVGVGSETGGAVASDSCSSTHVCISAKDPRPAHSASCSMMVGSSDERTAWMHSVSMISLPRSLGTTRNNASTELFDDITRAHSVHIAHVSISAV